MSPLRASTPSSHGSELASAVPIRPRPRSCSGLAPRHLMLLRPLAMLSAVWYICSYQDFEEISTFKCSRAIRARRSLSSMSEAHCSPFEYLILTSAGAHAGRDSPKSAPDRPSELEPAAPIPTAAPSHMHSLLPRLPVQDSSDQGCRPRSFSAPSRMRAAWLVESGPCGQGPAPPPPPPPPERSASRLKHARLGIPGQQRFTLLVKARGL